MKKGIKKNRHFSKGTHKFKSRNRLVNCKECKLRTENSRSEQLAEKSCKYNRIGLILQAINFLIDKTPQIVKFLLN